MELNSPCSLYSRARIYINVIIINYYNSDNCFLCYSIYCSDPFHDAFKDNEGIGVSQEGFVHIRIQQRNGRKTVTTVQGIGDEYDKRKIVKVCKKVGHTSSVYMHAKLESLLKS